MEKKREETEMHHAFLLPAIGELPLHLYHHSSPSILPPYSYPAHVHDGYELYILEEGSAAFSVDGTLYSLREGDAVFIRPGEIHSCIRRTDGKHMYYYFLFGEEATPFIDRLSRFTDGSTHFSLDEYGRRSILSLSRGCENAASTGDELLLFTLFWRLLCFLGGESCKAEPYPPQLSAIKADMDVRFAEPALLNALEKEHSTSASTLNRLSNRYLGTSPKKYIEKKRFALATRLLREGKSVGEAAQAAGFADASGFIRLFRLRFGVTPLAYRRLSNEKDTLGQPEDAKA